MVRKLGGGKGSCRPYKQDSDFSSGRPAAGFKSIKKKHL
jgi:hypothetical protein